MNAVTLRQVHKRYGAIAALDGFDLDVPSGSICGLVGPNGAGKTTTFGVIAGLIQMNGGAIDVLGRGPFHPGRHRGLITMLPQDCALNPHLSVRQILEYFARLQGLRGADAARDAARVLELVGLGERHTARITQLSHGMRRRVQIAQALIGSPELVLLDEPQSGLDPELVVHMRNVIRDQGRRSTVILSSHVLSELEELCDTIVFMERGKAVEAGAVSDITAAAARMRIRLDRSPPLDRLEALALGVNLTWDGETLVIELGDGLTPQAVNQRMLPLLLESGVGVLDITLGQSLEESYLAAVRKERGDAARPASLPSES